MANIFKVIFGSNKVEGPDKLGLYPERNHVPALPERRYLFTSRFLVIISTVNLCINIMLTFVLFYLLPQRRIVPRFMAIDSRFNTVSLVEPHERFISSLILAKENYIAEYIFLRHSIVNNTNVMNRQWGANSKIYWYSATKVFEEFHHNFVPRELAMVQENNITRTVEIKMISRRYFGIWRAEFLTHDTSPNFEGTKSTLWRALINVGFFPKAYPNRDEAMKNPLNFTITNYSLSSLGDPND